MATKGCCYFYQSHTFEGKLLGSFSKETLKAWWILCWILCWFFSHMPCWLHMLLFLPNVWSNNVCHYYKNEKPNRLKWCERTKREDHNKWCYSLSVDTQTRLYRSTGYAPSSKIFLNFASLTLAPRVLQIVLMSVSAVPRHVVPPGEGVTLKIILWPEFKQSPNNINDSSSNNKMVSGGSGKLGTRNCGNFSRMLFAPLQQTNCKSRLDLAVSDFVKRNSIKAILC